MNNPCRLTSSGLEWAVSLLMDVAFVTLDKLLEPIHHVRFAAGNGDSARDQSSSWSAPLSSPSPSSSSATPPTSATSSVTSSTGPPSHASLLSSWSGSESWTWW
ncbi:hypothetical protein ACLB2K_048972 [Fragaria x ananassa]